METAKRAQSRLRLYPKLVGECSPSAVEYARCVALRENIVKDDCSAEFQKFKKCITEAAKKMKIRV